MEKEIINKLAQNFEERVCKYDDYEYWMARDVQELLEYNEWRNFLNVIEKAKNSCQKSGYQIKDHFVDVNKMVPVGSKTSRDISDIMLTRYACYLIAQNGDPKKTVIACTQTYFALQTRKQELCL